MLVNPKKIIGRTADPIMTPEMSYERGRVFQQYHISLQCMVGRGKRE